VATGPTEPFASEETYREEEAPAASIGPRNEEEPAPRIDHAEYRASSRSDAWRLRHLMYLVAIAAVLLWVLVLAGGSMVFISLLVLAGIVLLFAGVMGSGVILARRRSTRQDSLLWLLAIAAERGMPLAPAVLAFADQYRGRAYARIMDLAARLNWGTTLPEALERAPNVVSRDAVLLAWVGQAAGRLPRALRMAASFRSTQLPIWTAIAARLSYVLGVLLVMQTITAFIMYFIMPKYEAIFRDFGISLPRVTIFVIDASQFVVRNGAVASLVMIFELGLLCFLPLSFLGWGNYTVPFFDRVLGRRHTALVLRSLALVVEGGKPIAVGLSTLANHYPTGWVRRRLVRVESAVHEGADWIESLLRYGLIRAAEAEVLSSAAAVGNLAWALLELADTTERRLATRFQLFIQTLFPLVVIMLGMAVFVIAVAYFAPLVQIISGLTGE